MTPLDDHDVRSLLERISVRLDYLSQTQASMTHALEQTREELRDQFDSYVRIETFKPIERLVYGLVAIIMAAVVSLWLGVLGGGR